ncbi:MAG TPA: transposase [Ktedonobacterales bacterium]|nr:transposase [Ktedonobacterales bacterium]
MPKQSREKPNERRTCKAFQYRLYPTPKQEQTLLFVLRRCRELYNSALEERRAHYQMHHTGIGYTRQAAELSEIKTAFPAYQDIYSQVLQDVLRRVDKTFAAFFRRVARGETPGYPRYKATSRYRSFTYPQSGFALAGNVLTLSKLGDLKVRLHRPMVGQVKTCTIKHDVDQWYVTFSCEVEEEPLPPSDEAVGIDLGLLHFATLSTGETIENPRHYRRGLKRIKILSQIKDQRKQRSHRRKRAAIALAQAHRTVRNQRKDFQHKAARSLVNRFGIIVFEDLQILNMSAAPDPKPDPDHDGAYLPNGASAKAGLNQSILDAGWGQFQQYCVAKAESAGRRVLFVDPRLTSQRCSQCGAIVKKDLSERWHSCSCGCELDRDHNAAINILCQGQEVAHSGTPL